LRLRAEQREREREQQRGALGFPLVDVCSMTPYGAKVKGFVPVVTLVHTARAGSTPVLLMARQAPHLASSGNRACSADGLPHGNV
jgi:hypothetical protein